MSCQVAIGAFKKIGQRVMFCVDVFTSEFIDERDCLKDINAAYVCKLGFKF